MLFSTHLLLFNRFENLDNTFLVICTVNPLKHLTVFSSPNLPHHLVIILLPVQSKLTSNSKHSPKTIQKIPI